MLNVRLISRINLIGRVETYSRGLHSLHAYGQYGYLLIHNFWSMNNQKEYQLVDMAVKLGSLSFSKMVMQVEQYLNFNLWQ